VGTETQSHSFPNMPWKNYPFCFMSSLGILCIMSTDSCVQILATLVFERRGSSSVTKPSERAPSGVRNVPVRVRYGQGSEKKTNKQEKIWLFSCARKQKKRERVVFPVHANKQGRKTPFEYLENYHRLWQKVDLFATVCEEHTQKPKQPQQILSVEA